MNTQGLTHVNQWSVYSQKLEKLWSTLIQSGKEWKKTTIWQKSESKTKEVTDWRRLVDTGWAQVSLI